jgi:hypothetical protein
MMRFALIASLVLAACGAKPVDTNGDGVADPTDPVVPNDVTQVAPSTPKGRVSGRVLSVQGVPILGANVAVSSTGIQAVKTDANGLFSIDHLTGNSSVNLYISMDAYAPASVAVTVPGTTGNFPLSDGEACIGDVRLLPTTGGLTFYVVGYDGALLDQVAATLDVTPGFVWDTKSAVVGMGDLPVTATSAAGTLAFTGIPKPQDVAFLNDLKANVSYNLYVAPVYDASNNLLYDGYSDSFKASELLSTSWSRTIVLPEPSAVAKPLGIVATNVENLIKPSPADKNLISRTSPLITVVFNQPIGKDVFVEIRDDEPLEKDSKTIGIGTPELNALGTVLKITPKGGTIADGQKYNLAIQASPRDQAGATPSIFGGPFFGGDLASPKTLTPPTVNLIDNIPLPNGDGNWEAGENLEIVFDLPSPVAYLGRGDPSLPYYIPVYFNNDLDGLDSTGNQRGELGSNIPICVPASEDVPGWMPGAKASGYAKKFILTPQVLLGTTVKFPVGGIAVDQLNLSVVFTDSFKCPNGSLQSVWGTTINTTFDNLTPTAVSPP